MFSRFSLVDSRREAAERLVVFDGAEGITEGAAEDATIGSIGVEDIKGVLSSCWFLVLLIGEGNQ